MRKIFFFTVSAFFFFSCGDKNKEAELYLENIHTIYQNGDYETARLKIDSIQLLYPKAFDQIKEGMALMQDVRRAQNMQQIAFCDSVIEVMSPRIDSLKRSFVYEENRDYLVEGRYLPKGVFSNPVLRSTMLRPGVEASGILFLESVFIGNNKYHDQINITAKDGSYAETLPVTDDGLNFRFTDAGRQYEVIKFAGKDENGVCAFVSAYEDMPLTINLKGKSSTVYPLNNAAKKAISDSYLLSTWMLGVDSLKNVKEKAEILIKYLDSKDGNSPMTEEGN